MKTYEEFDKTPRFQDVKIGTYIFSNYDEKERELFSQLLWGCGKCKILYESPDYVMLCEIRDEEYFVCPAKKETTKMFIFKSEYVCKERLRGEPRAYWEKRFLINA